MAPSRKLASLFVALTILAPPLAAETWTFELDPAATQVRFTLGATLHVVSGSLRAREGRIVLDPQTGAASGRIVLDARSAETGNRRRDEKMHAKILESARYPDVVFTVARVSGTLKPTGRSDLQLHGTLAMHGVERPLDLLATADAADGRVRARGDFRFPYLEWGMADPSFLVLRVADEVGIEIDAVGRLAIEPAGDDAAR
jgi:polyisoprenoid-binding protein YceI